MAAVKVVVAADWVAGTSSHEVGLRLARAWTAHGAQVALVPMGATAHELTGALCDAGRVEVSPDWTSARSAHDLIVIPPPVQGPPWTGSSTPIGACLRASLAEPRPRVSIDLTTVMAHDGGAGMLASLGATSNVTLDAGWSGLAGLTYLDLTAARQIVGQRRLVGLVAVGDLGAVLTGLRGVSSVHGRPLGVELADLVAADQALAGLAEAVGIDGVKPGTGAAGGAAVAVLALGGTIMTAPMLASSMAGLAATLTRADLVVTACTSLDMGSHGGGVVRHLADLAATAGKPLVVASPSVSLGTRELRLGGVEAAIHLDVTSDATWDSSARRGARSWMW